MIRIGVVGKKYSPEMALVILVCRVFFNNEDANAIGAYIKEQKIDWQLFNRIISAHQVRPLIYKVLSVNASSVDTAFLSSLRNKCMQIASGNLLKLDELSKLHELFNNAGVSNIPYKGVLLSEFIYGDFITRETADIDFLIPPSGFSKAKNILLQQGYKPGYYFDPAYEKQFVQTECEMLFTRQAPLGVIKVEIHWAVIHKMLDAQMNIDALLERPLKTVSAGKEFDRLQVEDRLWVMLAHHGVNDVWRTLRHVADLAAFMRKEKALLSSHDILQKLRSTKLINTTAVGIALCDDLFGEKAVSSFHRPRLYDNVLHNLLVFPALNRKKLSIENIRQQFLLRDNFKDKLGLALSYLRASFTPNIRDVETMPLHPRLYVLYYILKPFLFFARKKRQ